MFEMHHDRTQVETWYAHDCSFSSGAVPIRAEMTQEDVDVPYLSMLGENLAKVRWAQETIFRRSTALLDSLL